MWVMMNNTISWCIAKSRLFKSEAYFKFTSSCDYANLASASETGKDDFRTLDIRGGKTVRVSPKKKQSHIIFPPRSRRMAIDQDWSSVWPGPRTFHPASVPLPLRQGINKLGASPGKIGNVELIKIPNFLHLTPPAIKKHCIALKQFCTPWPVALHQDESCQKHFPLEIIQTDYCHSSPSIRNSMARIITIKFPLDRLKLDHHARDKFLRLVGDKYDPKTEMVTITTDKCPLRKQNYDYALYLLTALYFESWTYEHWEKEKSLADLEYYDWDSSKSKENTLYLLKQKSHELDVDSSPYKELKASVVDLFDDGENDYNLMKYKEAALSILFAGSC